MRLYLTSSRTWFIVVPMKKEKVVNVRLETWMLDELKILAKANDRTAAAEIRIAVRQHLGQELAATPTGTTANS